MIGHLARDELLAAIEEPTASTSAHLAECARCREEVRALRRVLVTVREAPVPEPSPLFWDHLSARVRAAIDADQARPAAAPIGWSRSRLRWLVALTTCALLLAAVGFQRWTQTPGPVPTTARAPVDEPLTTAAAGSDTDWDFLLAVSEDVEWSVPNAEGTWSPGTVERAVDTLSGTEREALAALLERELRDARRNSGDS